MPLNACTVCKRSLGSDSFRFLCKKCELSYDKSRQRDGTIFAFIKWVADRARKFAQSTKIRKSRRKKSMSPSPDTEGKRQ